MTVHEALDFLKNYLDKYEDAYVLIRLRQLTEEEE